MLEKKYKNNFRKELYEQYAKNTTQILVPWSINHSIWSCLN